MKISVQEMEGNQENLQKELNNIKTNRFQSLLDSEKIAVETYIIRKAEVYYKHFEKKQNKHNEKLLIYRNKTYNAR